jgi:hypothetical protein
MLVSVTRRVPESFRKAHLHLVIQLRAAYSAFLIASGYAESGCVELNCFVSSLREWT